MIALMNAPSPVTPHIARRLVRGHLVWCVWQNRGISDEAPVCMSGSLELVQDFAKRWHNTGVYPGRNS